MTLLLGLLLAAPMEQEPVHLHGGLSLGIGTAYSIVGVRGELGSEHIGVFVGTGLNTTTGTWSSGGASVSFGGRWYNDVRRGWFASLNFMYAWSDWLVDTDRGFNSNGPMSTSTLFTAGFTAGYRFKLEALFLDVGAGGTWFSYREAAYCQVPCVQPIPTQGHLSHGILPDAVVGFGFDL